MKRADETRSRITDLQPRCLISGEIAAHVLDAIRTGVLVVESNGLILHHNTSASEILEQPFGTLCGASLDILLAPLPILFEGVVDHDRGELSHTLPSGKDITLGYHLANIGNSGQVAVVFQNITSWAKLRQERDHLLQLAAVGQVMPTLLHELKNPLASISTAVEVLIEELVPGGLRDELHAILGELRRMRLSFDGIGAVGRNLRSQRLAAIDFAIREALLVLKARTDNVGVGLICDVQDMPLLYLEPAVVRAIVFNLVVNSLEACKSGGTIALRAHLTDQQRVFELRVIDTGCGMTPDELARCTELFFTTKPNGTGIGLALCSHAVEAAGGKLTIESREDEGTMVCVRVPLDGRGAYTNGDSNAIPPDPAPRAE